MEDVKYKRLAMGKKTSTIHFTYFNIYTSNHFIIEQDIDSEVFMKKKMPQYFLNRSTYWNCVHVLLRYRLNFSSFLWYFQWMLLNSKAYNSSNDTLLPSFHFHELCGFLKKISCYKSILYPSMNINLIYVKMSNSKGITKMLDELTFI